MHHGTCHRSRGQPYGRAQRWGWWWVYENCEDTNLWCRGRYDSSRTSRGTVWALLAGEEFCVHAKPCPGKGLETRERVAAAAGWEEGTVAAGTAAGGTALRSGDGDGDVPPAEPSGDSSVQISNGAISLLFFDYPAGVQSKLSCSVPWRCFARCKNWWAAPWPRGVPRGPGRRKPTALPGEGRKEKVDNNVLRAALSPESGEYSIKQFGKQFIGALAAALYSSVRCTVFQEVLLELYLKIVVLICSS